jgi:hypothetical protein
MAAAQRSDTDPVAGVDLRDHTGAADGPSVVEALRRGWDASIESLAGRLLATLPEPVRTVPAKEIWLLVNAHLAAVAGCAGVVGGSGPAGLSVMAAISLRAGRREPSH